MVMCLGFGLQKCDSNIMINIVKGKKMIKQEQIEGQSLESNQSVEFQYLTNKTYEELLISHERAKRFIQDLEGLKDTPVIDSLLTYSNDARLGFKSSELVMELMESRLNKMIKNNKLKKNWSEEDLHILVWLLSKYMERNSINCHEQMTKQDWTNLSSMIPGSSPKSCMFKFVSLKKFKLAHHKWQKEEENILFKIVIQIGTKNWKTIAEKLYQQNTKKKIYRTAKQCRQHWSCYLDPKIKKGPWQRQQDRKLLLTVLQSNCQKKWSAIKQQFEGRTENALKNRYNLLLQKQKKLSPLEKQIDLILENLKEDREDTSDHERRVEKEVNNPTTITIPEPVFPVIPEERRNNNMQYSQGFLLVFNNAQTNVGDKMQGIPMNTWFFPL